MTAFEQFVDFFCRPFYCFVPRDIIIQFSKFALIGVVGFVVDFSFFHLGLDVLGFGHYYSALFSFPFAVTATWIGNRSFTFRGQSKHKVHQEWARFALVCLVGLVLNRGTFMLLTATVSLVYEYPVLGLIGGTAMAMFFNFFGSKKLVFR